MLEQQRYLMKSSFAATSLFPSLFFPRRYCSRNGQRAIVLLELLEGNFLRLGNVSISIDIFNLLKSFSTDSKFLLTLDKSENFSSLKKWTHQE